MEKTPKSLLSVALFAALSPVAAQNNTPSNALDTVMVSARGISENPLSTPFIVRTISEKDIADNNFVNVQDVFRSDTSSDLHNGGNISYSNVWMRGMGALTQSSIDDTTVDFRIDGISNGKTGLIRNLIDVERVEIAKGPQGTILGSQAQAGVYTVKTNDPSDDLEGSFGIGIGNKNQKMIQGVINAPLSNNVSIRLSGMSDIQDNYLNKSEDGSPLNTKKKQGIQAKIGWHDDDYKNKVVLGAYYDRNTNNVPMLQKDFSTYAIKTGYLPHKSNSTAQGLTLRVESDLNFAQLSSHTGYFKYYGMMDRPYMPPELSTDNYKAGNIPGVLWPILDNFLAIPENNRQRWTDDYSQLSQEFRLSSNPEDDIKWVAGLYLERRIQV